MDSIRVSIIQTDIVWENKQENPVSYTHLDVYKRQDNCYATSEADAGIER